MNIALWIVQILLALSFGFAGVLKLSQPIAKLQVQLKWVETTPDPLVRFIGLAELLAALGLILPQALNILKILTPLAGLGLLIIMICALVLHAAREGISSIPSGIRARGTLVLCVRGTFGAWGLGDAPSPFSCFLRSTMNDIPIMPAAFIGHGSPMNALETNLYTTSWERFGSSLPPPRAALVISAHWYIDSTMLTAMHHPRTIYDFWGFPPELSRFQYPAPGAPEIAAEIAEVITPDAVDLDHGLWGLDHGTWVVLSHLLPAANIPVIQLSINANKPLSFHMDLGAKLSALQRQGILVVGSGNIVHNLDRVDFSKPELGFAWNHRFDEAVKSTVLSAPQDLPNLESHEHFIDAVPTPEHFIPLAYLAGMAAALGAHPTVLVEGYVAGSLSMTSYIIRPQNHR